MCATLRNIVSCGMSMCEEVRVNAPIEWWIRIHLRVCVCVHVGRKYVTLTHVPHRNRAVRECTTGDRKTWHVGEPEIRLCEAALTNVFDLDICCNLKKNFSFFFAQVLLLLHYTEYTASLTLINTNELYASMRLSRKSNLNVSYIYVGELAWIFTSVSIDE